MIALDRSLPQYAALCSRIEPVTGQEVVLLVTSRGKGHWIIPKGNPIAGKRPHQVAACEAEEEAGVTGTIHERAIGQYRYVKHPENSASTPFVVTVFSLKVSSLLSSFKEKGERQMIWLPRHQAAQLVQQSELRALITATA